MKYDEDIFSFLPKDEEYAESMRVFSQLNELSRIVIIFESHSPDSICSAIDATNDYLPDAITQPDIDGFQKRLQFIYQHLPYFLTDSDYQTLHHKLTPEIIHENLLVTKEIITTPGTSFLLPLVANDPLHLISLSKGASGQYATAQSSFTSYDGYMMSSDYKKGFAFYDSPYGSTESSNNAILVDSLNEICNKIHSAHPAVSVHIIGAPVIAVTNAKCIKNDSILAMILSLFLIICLLLYAFPVKRDLLLILASILFGWLCGIATLRIFFSEASIIVIGMSSVFIGISVNYPLHLLVHQRYTTSVRQTLQEVLFPLIVGNITTVGAFIALIPLKSSALCQLGIFAAADLIGTILFCIFCLPHLMHIHHTTIREIHLPYHKHINKIITPKVQNVCVVLLLIAAALLPIFHPYELFDPNISHINYMTPEQKNDFAFFENLNPTNTQQTYTIPEARAELEQRVKKWNDFWSRQDIHNIIQNISNQSDNIGLRSDLFIPFYTNIQTTYQPTDLSSPDTLAALWPGRFNTESMNTKVSTSLSENFNYLTIVCSLIVLIFLCLSFRSIIVGMIAFLPMVFSWIFIIAIMQIFDLQFNIINIILATFIFGQGDDYTIFVVEGLIYEKRTGKPLLDQYKQSIILSAAIMLIAIGVLIISRHPALFSLGAVILVGMTSVVIMAYIIPPILLNICEKIPFLRTRISHYYQK